MELVIETAQGKVKFTPKRMGKSGFNISIPVGMRGRDLDDVMFYNEEQIEKFRNEVKNHEPVSRKKQG